ncbi:MAG: hypothetical protein P8015_07340 [Acidihalobacter sp.]
MSACLGKVWDRVQCAQQAEVGGGKGIGFAQCAHGDVLRRPRTDSGQSDELGDGLFQGFERAQQLRVFRHCPAQLAQRFGARAR